jgi:steroid delta-isomerase-like uncharacterized protein
VSVEQENKALIRRYFEAIDTGKIEVLDEFVAADFFDHSPLPGTSADREGLKQAFTFFLATTPGYHTVDDLIAEGDKIVARITGYGTHAGEIMGVPATGKPLQFGGISIWRIADGKIVEHWSQVDMLSPLQQLGIIPPLP